MQAADLLATPAWILSFLRVAAASMSRRINSRLLVDDDRRCFQSVLKWFCRLWTLLLHAAKSGAIETGSMMTYLIDDWWNYVSNLSSQISRLAKESIT